MWYRHWWQHAIVHLPFGVLCFHKWSKRPFVLAIGVVPINLCECGLVSIRGRKWPRRWDMGMGRPLNKGVRFWIKCIRINATHSSLRDRKWDRHIRSPFCQVIRGLGCGFRNAKHNRARSP